MKFDFKSVLLEEIFFTKLFANILVLGFILILEFIDTFVSLNFIKIH